MPVEHVTSAVPTWVERQTVVKPFHDYYRGNQPLKFATADFKRKYGQIVAGVRENICVASVTGFVDEIEITEWSGGTIDDELVADLERLADLVFTELMRCGDAFIIVAERADGSRLPIYQPANTVVPVVDDDDPTRLQHAVKIWDASDNFGYATVYYGDHLERYRTVKPVRDSNSKSKLSMPTKSDGWVEYDPDGDDGWFQEHNFGGVPVVWFKFDADDHWGWGNSILSDVTPIQDLLNKVTADLAVLAESYSRPLYYILKMKPSDALPASNRSMHPLAGAITNDTPSDLSARPGMSNQAPFSPTRQQIMAIEGEGPVGQFTPADIAKLIELRADLRQSVSTVTGLPQYIFTPTSGDVPSGESLKVVSRRQAAVIRRATRPTIPLWRGVMELLGHPGVTPVFREVNPDPAEPTDPVQV